jgi:hypothetical protein
LAICWVFHRIPIGFLRQSRIGKAMQAYVK